VNAYNFCLSELTFLLRCGGWSGLSYIVFAVDDVRAFRNAVIAAWGWGVGQLVSVDIPGAGRISHLRMSQTQRET